MKQNLELNKEELTHKGISNGQYKTSGAFTDAFLNLSLCLRYRVLYIPSETQNLYVVEDY